MWKIGEVELDSWMLRVVLVKGYVPYRYKFVKMISVLFSRVSNFEIRVCEPAIK